LVYPAAAVVSATLKVVGIAMLGTHDPVSLWTWNAMALVASIGDPPPTDIKTSAPDSLNCEAAS
jgi:hypothetical protein